MKYNPTILRGNWRKGWALDLHMEDPVKTVALQRTYLGELLYQVKYLENFEVMDKIVDIAIEFLKTRYVLPYLSAIVPIPPSKKRDKQLVIEMAKKIGEYFQLPVPLDYLVKNKETPQLKDIKDPDERREILKDAFSVKDLRFAGKYILLFDDICRSGETLKAATSVLMKEGKVERVYVLTITKTLRN